MIFIFPTWTFINREDDDNLLEMSYNDINSLRKKDLVEQIEKMKGKDIFDSHIKDLCNQIKKLTESLNQVTEANEKITSEFVIVKNSSLIEGITLKYLEFRMKYLMMILKTMSLRFVKIQRMIIKFINRKHSKVMLHSKKSISSKSKVYINHSLSPSYRYISENAKICKGKTK